MIMVSEPVFVPGCCHKTSYGVEAVSLEVTCPVSVINLNYVAGSQSLSQLTDVAQIQSLDVVP